MAEGTITQLKVLSRFDIPGGGKTATGTASNRKAIVTGELQGTYLTTGGIGFQARGGPQAIGLSTIDFISFDVKSVAGSVQADEALYNATYNHSTGNIFVCNDGLTKPTDADACVIKFLAVGDTNDPGVA